MKKLIHNAIADRMYLAIDEFNSANEACQNADIRVDAHFDSRGQLTATIYKKEIMCRSEMAHRRKK